MGLRLMLAVSVLDCSWSWRNSTIFVISIFRSLRSGVFGISCDMVRVGMIAHQSKCPTFSYSQYNESTIFHSQFRPLVLVAIHLADLWHQPGRPYENHPGHDTREESPQRFELNP